MRELQMPKPAHDRFLSARWKIALGSPVGRARRVPRNHPMWVRTKPVPPKTIVFERKGSSGFEKTGFWSRQLVRARRYGSASWVLLADDRSKEASRGCPARLRDAQASSLPLAMGMGGLTVMG